jgi:hypothetical protein
VCTSLSLTILSNGFSLYVLGPFLDRPGGAATALAAIHRVETVIHRARPLSTVPSEVMASGWFPWSGTGGDRGPRWSAQIAAVAPRRWLFLDDVEPGLWLDEAVEHAGRF